MNSNEIVKSLQERVLTDEFYDILFNELHGVTQRQAVSIAKRVSLVIANTIINGDEYINGR